METTSMSGLHIYLPTLNPDYRRSAIQHDSSQGICKPIWLANFLDSPELYRVYRKHFFIKWRQEAEFPDAGAACALVSARKPSAGFQPAEGWGTRATTGLYASLTEMTRRKSAISPHPTWPLHSCFPSPARSCSRKTSTG